MRSHCLHVSLWLRCCNIRSITYVGSSGDRQALGTSLEREDLAGDDPGQRTPGGGKEEDVDTDKGDRGLLCGKVVDDDVSSRILTGRGRAEHGNEELTDAHADGTPEEQGSATELLYSPETGQGGSHVDARRNHGDGEGVLDTRVLKVLGSVVEDEVDTGELLEGLDSHSRELTLEHLSLEAIEVARLSDAHLEVVVRLDLVQLGLDGGSTGRKSSELAQ